MTKTPPRSVDTVIVGNGPSALILSYILHGHIPTYARSRPHLDALLDQKLRKNGNLLTPDVEHLTEHFGASRFSYSTQALPINVLLDTLLRPHGETDDTGSYTCIHWEHAPERAIDHVVIGDTPRPGGQWVDNPADASWDIETLSYAGMLSLPGYTFSEHYERIYHRTLPAFQRPTRREVATYLAEYPKYAGLQDTIYCEQTLAGISRNSNGFHIASHDITCRHLVLATGIFTKPIPPRPLLQPLVSLPKRASSPLLVIGSGFSAADVILSAPTDRKLIHVYKWAPGTSPSPLRACHQQAYPDYAGVYRRMKIAATSHVRHRAKRPRLSRSATSAFDSSRNWDEVYEGLPNTSIIDVQVHGDTATITCQKITKDEPPFEREVSGLSYVVGRRGSLSYLDPQLQAEVCEDPADAQSVSGHTLRQKSLASTEMADNVFITGSLTGDSLVRFAYGGCTYAAGMIMARQGRADEGNANANSNGNSNGRPRPEDSNTSGTSSPKTNPSSRSSPGRSGLMNGLDGHNIHSIDLSARADGLDRRKE